MQKTELKEVPKGGIIITSGGRLYPKYVLHVRSPEFRYDGKDSKNKAELEMKECIRNILNKAESLQGVKRICMHALSTGKRNKFPKKMCSEIMLKTCVNWLKEKGPNTKI